MKKLIYIPLLLLLIACDSDKGLNCFQAAGTIISSEIETEDFTKIAVYERIQLIVIKGNEYEVVVETGENLLNDIEVKVEDDQLILINNNGCNVVRDYGITKVFVTTPNLTEIRNSSGLTVESQGVLSYSNLTLLSEDQEEEDAFHSDGDFKLQLAVDELRVVTTGLSDFILSGTATTATFLMNNGDTSIDAGALFVENVILFQRSTDDLIVNPQQSIMGEIVNSGNVFSKHEPPIVNVTEVYTGRLIFE